MPLYEFACNACGAQVSVFVRSINADVAASCQHCGGADLRRLISRFAVVKSSSGLDGLEAGMAGLDENDPRAVAAWARRMQQETGEDMGPEFDEMVQRMERGEAVDEGSGNYDADGGDLGDLMAGGL